MSGFWAVLVREIRERRAILLAAVALGILPIVVGSIPALTRIGGADLREDFAMVLGLAFPTAVALGLGASVIGRDVAEGRLGFYFSRPISGFALWAGKMGATVILVGASALLVSLPTRLVFVTGGLTGLAALAASVVGVDGLLVPMGSHDPWFWRLAFAVLILGAAGAHAAGTMLRSRSGLLPVDLGLLVATSFAFAAAAWRIVDAGAHEMFVVLLPSILWSMLAVCLAAGAVQLVAGRSDRKRGHLFLSVALWGSLLAGAGALHLVLSWAFATTPGDIAFNRSAIACAPRGNYFALTGYGGRIGYNPTFLVDADAGHFVRVDNTDGAWAVAFAPQGHTAVWLGTGPQHMLGMVALAGPLPVVRTVRLPPGVGDGEYPWILALSPDGQRVLIEDSNGTGVVETASGRLVVQAKSPRAWQAYFESNDLVRLVSGTTSGTTASGHEPALLEWDLRTGQLREVGRFGDALRVVDLRAGHLLMATRQRGLEIRDAKTGRLEETVLAPSAERAGLHPDSPLYGRFLADGRVAVVLPQKDGAHLRVFASKASADLDVLVGRAAALIGESAPGELILHDRTVPGSQTLFVDAATGEIRKKETGLEPVAWPWRDFRQDSVPGTAETRLFVSQDGALVNRDPVTGARRVVVQGQKARDEE